MKKIHTLIIARKILIILFCKIWTTCKKERDCYFMAINWGKQADFLHSVLRAAKLSSERKKMFLFSKEPENINWASVCGNYMQETRYEKIKSNKSKRRFIAVRMIGICKNFKISFWKYDMLILRKCANHPDGDKAVFTFVWLYFFHAKICF